MQDTVIPSAKRERIPRTAKRDPKTRLPRILHSPHGRHRQSQETRRWRDTQKRAGQGNATTSAWGASPTAQLVLASRAALPARSAQRQDALCLAAGPAETNQSLASTSLRQTAANGEKGHPWKRKCGPGLGWSVLFTVWFPSASTRSSGRLPKEATCRVTRPSFARRSAGLRKRMQVRVSVRLLPSSIASIHPS